MPFEFKSEPESSVLEIKVSGKLHADDYQDFIPRLEQSVQGNGKRSILFDMDDFHGWDVAALWQGVKFDVRHFASFERIAMVGDKKWERWMTELYRPFTSAEVRFFDRSEIDTARRWAEGRKGSLDPQPS